jgi:hypothetical protein
MNGSTDRATWVHPRVAINIAQWISPKFDVKVSAWVYDLHEMLNIPIMVDLNNINTSQDTKSPTDKYDTGKCFYIIKDKNITSDIFKIGISKNINKRFKQYLTTLPEPEIKYLKYLDNNYELEQHIKTTFKDTMRNEHIFNVELSKIIEIIELYP